MNPHDSFYVMDNSTSSNNNSDDSNEVTPTSKLLRNYHATISGELGNVREVSDKKKVVLVSTGSFCPVHLTHIAMFEAAKRHLENENYKVVGGYLSPSHDDYVKGKMKSVRGEHIVASHRVRMCQIAVKESSWLMVDRWESSQKNFVDPMSVMDHMKQVLRDCSITDVELMYMCGYDLLPATCGFYKVVAVGRNSGPDGLGSYMQQFLSRWILKGQLILVKDWVLNDISSGSLQETLNQGGSIDRLIHPGVKEYLEHYGFCKSRNRSTSPFTVTANSSTNPHGMFG